MSMKENKYSEDSPSSKMKGRKISLKDAAGVYDENPDPGLRQYKHSMGKDTLPIKFEEPDFRTSPNQMETQIKRGRASKPTTSRVNNSKNRYEGPVKKKVMGSL